MRCHDSKRTATSYENYETSYENARYHVTKMWEYVTSGKLIKCHPASGITQYTACQELRFSSCLQAANSPAVCTHNRAHQCWSTIAALLPWPSPAPNRPPFCHCLHHRCYLTADRLPQPAEVPVIDMQAHSPYVRYWSMMMRCKARIPRGWLTSWNIPLKRWTSTPVSAIV